MCPHRGTPHGRSVMNDIVVTALNIALAITNVVIMAIAVLVVRLPRRTRNAWFGRPECDVAAKGAGAPTPAEAHEDTRPVRLQF